MSSLETKLKKLKNLDLTKFQPNLWIIHRELNAKERTATYQPYFVKTEDALKKKLRDTVRKVINISNRVEPYEHINVDPDLGTVLGVSSAETDLQSIELKISQGSDGSEVTNQNQLFGAWAYAIHLSDGTNQIVAVRKIPSGWSVKQVEKYMQVVFRNHMLIDLDDKTVFRLDGRIDFFSFEEAIFILNKRDFERILNFRAGMEKSRDAVVEELNTAKIIDNADLFKKTISDNLTHLRRIAQVKKNGFYLDPDFISKCKKACKKRKWPIEFKGNTIVVTQDNITLILRLLNDDRLTSVITDQDFDVDVKHKVASA